jgi:hypothetical protein
LGARREDTTSGVRDRQGMKPFDPDRAFRAAVRDLAEDATPLNVRRYLAASALLERATDQREQAQEPRKAA